MVFTRTFHKWLWHNIQIHLYIIKVQYCCSIYSSNLRNSEMQVYIDILGKFGILIAHKNTNKDYCIIVHHFIFFQNEKVLYILIYNKRYHKFGLRFSTDPIHIEYIILY